MCIRDRNMEISAQVKKLVDLPVIVTNRINDPQMADTLINMDKADFIGMGRGSLTDPDLPLSLIHIFIHGSFTILS